MKPRHHPPAALTAILAVLALILAASVLAEKSHGDHLPERNSGGGHLPLIVSGLLAGILSTLSAAHILPGDRNGSLPRARTAPGNAYCMMQNSPIPAAWPMRQ